MTSLPSIAAHAKSHDIEPQKKLGQNFIFDSTLCDKIVSSSPTIDSKLVLEVGPGPGGLTRSILAAKPSKLIIIEKDQRCLRLLEELKLFYPELEIISDDALKIQLPEITKGNKITIISNLPYNIGTELLFRWLDYPELVDSMTLMLQKEVVDRICAKPDTKIYGKLSVICQLLADVKKEFDVSPLAFYPPPKVTSSIVNLIPKTPYLDRELIKTIRELIHNAFNARRKMLRSSLKMVPVKIFEDLNISQTMRAENLTPSDYLAIAKAIMK